MKVFFTVDVEIWCDGWEELDRKFPDAFRSYIYGNTKNGCYGLPLKLQLLNEYGLNGSFFVEPLFALRFGIQPLAEVVGLIQEARQEIQLHLHPEWVNEGFRRLFPEILEKRQYMRYFSVEQQQLLVREGLALLRQVGAGDVMAFRAGGFGFNLDTLHALHNNSIMIDSSYNPCCMGLDSGVAPGEVLFQPSMQVGVYEYPMTVFQEGSNWFRHAQLGACSFRELEKLLWLALEQDWQSVVILSHNFELLNRARTAPDWIVVNRFRKLCQFLDRHRNVFETEGFSAIEPRSVDSQPAALKLPRIERGLRVLEQLWRYSYG